MKIPESSPIRGIKALIGGLILLVLVLYWEFTPYQIVVTFGLFFIYNAVTDIQQDSERRRNESYEGKDR